VDINNLSPMQKHNKRVDEVKNKWSLAHGIPIMRIWEEDIRHNPSTVMKELKKRLKVETEKKELLEKNNKRHKNTLK
jgi:very-short-patch-repair endonuclease